MKGNILEFLRVFFELTQTARASLQKPSLIPLPTGWKIIPWVWYENVDIQSYLCHDDSCMRSTIVVSSYFPKFIILAKVFEHLGNLKYKSWLGQRKEEWEPKERKRRCENKYMDVKREASFFIKVEISLKVENQLCQSFSCGCSDVML